MKIKTPGLFRKQCYINGTWQDAQSGATFAVHNPSTGALIGLVPKMGAEETQRAIQAASLALPEWKARTAKERSQILRRWYELILEHIDDLAAIMTSEQGKPLYEAKMEIRYSANFVEWFAEEAKRAYGDIIPFIKINDHKCAAYFTEDRSLELAANSESLQKRRRRPPGKRRPQL